MKDLKRQLAGIGIVTCLVTLAVSCNDQNTASGINGSDNAQDTNRVDTRRNSGDTTNYLTKDTGNQSQEVIDPNPPTDSH